MKRTISLFLVTLLSAGLSLSAQEKKPQEEKKAAKPELTKAGADFLQKAAEINLAEIALGKLGKEKASSDATKDLAKHLVDDHQKLQKKVEGMAKAKDVQLPTEPTARHKSLVDKLREHDGDKFDREFAEENVEAHKKAIALYEKNLDKVQDPDLKNYIKETLPGLKEHLKMAAKTQPATVKKEADKKDPDKKKQP